MDAANVSLKNTMAELKMKRLKAPWSHLPAEGMSLFKCTLKMEDRREQSRIQSGIEIGSLINNSCQNVVVCLRRHLRSAVAVLFSAEQKLEN